MPLKIKRKERYYFDISEVSSIFLTPKIETADCDWKRRIKPSSNLQTISQSAKCKHCEINVRGMRRKRQLASASVEEEAIAHVARQPQRILRVVIAAEEITRSGKLYGKWHSKHPTPHKNNRDFQSITRPFKAALSRPLCTPPSSSELVETLRSPWRCTLANLCSRRLIFKLIAKILCDILKCG